VGTIAASTVAVGVVVIVGIFLFYIARKRARLRHREEASAAFDALEKSMQQKKLEQLERRFDESFAYNKNRFNRTQSDFKFYLQKDASPDSNANMLAGMNATIASGDSVQYELDQTRLHLDRDHIYLASFSDEQVPSPSKRRDLLMD
jgi:hypothetical protein